MSALLEDNCYYCGLSEKKHGKPLNAEHKIPKCRGGAAKDQSNIVPACGRCNSRKGRKTIDEFRKLIGDETKILDFRFIGELPNGRDWIAAYSI